MSTYDKGVCKFELLQDVDVVFSYAKDLRRFQFLNDKFTSCIPLPNTNKTAVDGGVTVDSTESGSGVDASPKSNRKDMEEEEDDDKCLPVGFIPRDLDIIMTERMEEGCGHEFLYVHEDDCPFCLFNIALE